MILENGDGVIFSDVPILNEGIISTCGNLGEQ